jgi:hypothetical protein
MIAALGLNPAAPLSSSEAKNPQRNFAVSPTISSQYAKRPKHLLIKG